MNYTLPEFLAHAIALEHEAAERYLELADMMEAVIAAVFLDAVTSNYGAALRSRAAWAVETAGDLPDSDAARLLERTIGRWKTEFVVDDTEDEL